MKEIRVQNLVLGMLATNCWFLQNPETKELLIVDPAASPERIFQQVTAMEGKPAAVLLTHGHYDHVGAVAALREQTGCKVYMDPADAAGSQMLPLSRGLVDENWPEGDELTIDELTFRVYHTPGHTPGSVCLQCGGLLFSGDTLFAGSCGRTDLPGGSMAQMQKSLSMLAALPLPDETQVLPGHEAFSTLGRERRGNPCLNGAWF